jgi:hypothetical protein
MSRRPARMPSPRSERSARQEAARRQDEPVHSLVLEPCRARMVDELEEALREVGPPVLGMRGGFELWTGKTPARR